MTRVRLIDRLLRRSVPRSHRFADGEREALYPPPYPTGWYRVANSDQLRRGGVLAVDCLGQHLVAFRGRDSGQVSVLEAHCPHQGASLAAGGKVCGDSISCPFHNWRYDAEGRLIEIPGVERLPRVGLRRWPVRELYGMVWIWHHHSGERREPDYEPMPQEDIDVGDLTFRGQHDAGEVHMHLAEFAENSVDFQHFQAIHGKLTVPWTQLTVPGVGIRHIPGWEPDAELPHVAYFLDDACLTFRGRPYPQTGARACITFLGPGSIVWFRISFPDIGDVHIFQTHTPAAPLRQRVYFRWYADRRIPGPLASWVVGNWVSQWQADIEVWENKLYRRKPVLVPIDGPVHRMRRWYRQFYEDAAPTAQVDSRSA